MISLLVIGIFSIFYSANSLYSSFYYGNPQKMIESENLALEYLKKEKGYSESDILVIKGKYNYKKGKGDKYEGFIYLKNDSNKKYEYTISEEKVLEYDVIPQKRDK